MAMPDMTTPRLPPTPHVRYHLGAPTTTGEERGNAARHADLVHAGRQHRREGSGQESRRLPPGTRGVVGGCEG